MYLSGVTFTSGISPPTRRLSLAITSHSSHDVGPGAATDLLAALVGRYRFEHVVAAPVGFGDVLDGGGRRDLIAGHHQLAPLKLLPAVDHQREVELDLRDRKSTRLNSSHL